MAWLEITADEYARHFANPVACYMKADFNMLNAEKVDVVRFFAFEDNGMRIGLAVGEKGDEWRSPYSAPFCGFVCPQMQTIACLNSAMRELKGLLLSQKKTLKVTLPPIFYDRMFYSKVVSALLQNGFKCFPVRLCEQDFDLIVLAHAVNLPIVDSWLVFLRFPESAVR